jgi:hypothetical protein
LLDQRVDFFRRQFPGILGHVALAVGDDAAQVMGGGSGGFFGVERWPAEVPALSVLSVTLRAIFLED